MIKTFVLLATIWYAPTESNHILDVYTIDSGLTGTDCTEAIAAGIEALPLDGLTVDLSNAILSCELDVDHDI